jgi:hypothetical protein
MLGTANCDQLVTDVGINIASFPGRTVWQKAITSLKVFCAPTVFVPGTQYGLFGKGLLISPFESQYNPPFYSSQ